MTREEAIALGKRRADMFIQMTQRRGAPMIYGSGRPPEPDKKTEKKTQQRRKA